MPSLTLSTHCLHYESIGSGKPLIFLHGLGGSMQQIRDTYLPIEGIRLILLDQQGHGASTMQETGLCFPILARDVITVADHLGLDMFYLAGISMGAAVSLRTAMEEPERIAKLILIRNAWVDHPMEKRFCTLYQTAARYLQKKDRKGFMQTNAFLDIEQESHQAAASFLRFFDDEASCRYYQKYDILPGLQPFAAFDELKQITADTLVLANHQDPIHPFAYGEQISRGLQHARFYEITSKEVDAQAHKKQLNGYIRAFLSEGME